MFIEMAADGLKTADPNMLTAEIKELGSFGNARIATALSDLWPLVGDAADNAFSGMNHDSDVVFAQGYLLGLQVARTILAGSPQLLLNKIKPESLL